MVSIRLIGINPQNKMNNRNQTDFYYTVNLIIPNSTGYVTTLADLVTEDMRSSNFYSSTGVKRYLGMRICEANMNTVDELGLLPYPGILSVALDTTHMKLATYPGILAGATAYMALSYPLVMETPMFNVLGITSTGKSPSIGFTKLFDSPVGDLLSATISIIWTDIAYSAGNTSPYTTLLTFTIVESVIL